MNKPARVRMTGPLAPYAEGFREELARRGYAPLSADNVVRVMAHLSRWLKSENLSPDELTVECAGAFLEARRAAGYTSWLSMHGLSPLLGFLRAHGVAPEPTPATTVFTPLETLLSDYRTYLVDERGLAKDTVRRREHVARLFLTERCRVAGGDLHLGELTAAEVGAFVVAECPVRSVSEAKTMVIGLRVLLRFLHVDGRVPEALGSAVPAVSGWRGGSLPRALPSIQIRLLMASCDRRRVVGRRDFAILALLARLGLRAGEVASLELGDIDWRAGEVMVRGKGRREERLPLPVDVGEAIAGYLCRRPSSTDRHVFLRAIAPHCGVTRAAVTNAVRNACRRAGLAPIGAHRLRHTTATEMLRAGATLAEIGQVLRHRSLSTTAIYAKVDRSALRGLALPWPGGGA